MKKENEKLEARVEALEKRVRTLEAMFNSPAAYAPPCAHNSSPETQRTLPLRQGHESPVDFYGCGRLRGPKGEGVDYPTRGVDNARQVVHANGLNEKAWELMEKARKGGLLDEEYRPKCSLTTAALLASQIAEAAGMENKWRVFGDLWGIPRKRLSSMLQRALFQASTNNKEASIKTILFP